MRIKICGITDPEQGAAIAELGANALGFICVSRSPRYLEPARIREIIERLPSEVVRVGVFANAEPEAIAAVVGETGLSAVQLHGDESVETCDRLRGLLPGIELIKAIRVENRDSLAGALLYCDRVDWLLLDAYHPERLGGTGQTLDWQALQGFQPPLPWLLAGGLKPDNIHEALASLRPDGIDLSSGVERSPGNKDLTLVAQLFARLAETAAIRIGGGTRF